tara:strand:+ start:1240 stop:2070 length:831 start_codon:yes stop_codon:yes gene_type:complete
VSSLTINTFEDYREMEGLNWSKAKWATKCLRTMRLSDKPRDPSPDMRFGQDVHSALLEPSDFQSRTQPAPEGLRRGSKEWKRLEEEAAESGRRLLKAKEYRDILEVVSAVGDNPDAKRLIYEIPGISEASVQWKDRATGMLLKARIDRYCEKGTPEGDGLIVDIKTTQDINNLQRRLVKFPYMYLHQMAFYRRGVREYTGQDVVNVAILAVEKEVGFPTGVFHLDPTDLDMADKEIDALLYTISEAELFGPLTEQYESSTLRPPQWWMDQQQGATS